MRYGGLYTGLYTASSEVSYGGLYEGVVYIGSSEVRASDFPRSRKTRGIRGIADLKRNP